MQHRTLGRTDIAVAPIVFGGNVFGWTADEAASFALLDAFVDAGFNCIDTADVYSRWAPGHTGGESETIIGNWLARRGRRDDVVIATKVGSDMGDGRKGLAGDYIRQAVEDSLRRLQTDRIDLYQEHFDDGAAPVEETMAAFAELVQAGKVRALGASNISPERLRESQDAAAKHGAPRYETLQPHYNLVERETFERDFAPICAEHGLSILPYWSLASGYLTGKYRSEADLGKSQRGGAVKKYLEGHGPKVLSALDAVAEERSATAAQVALAWLVAKGTFPIASATSVAQWQELAKAADLTLSAEDVTRLDAASAG